MAVSSFAEADAMQGAHPGQKHCLHTELLHRYVSDRSDVTDFARAAEPGNRTHKQLKDPCCGKTKC